MIRASRSARNAGWCSWRIDPGKSTVKQICWIILVVENRVIVKKRQAAEEEEENTTERMNLIDAEKVSIIDFTAKKLKLRGCVPLAINIKPFPALLSVIRVKKKINYIDRDQQCKNQSKLT